MGLREAIGKIKDVEVIKWEPQSTEGNDIVVYKHDKEDFGCEAQLLVAPNQIALFVNEGEVVPFVAGHYTLNDSNNSSFKFINKWRTVFSNGVSSFHCLVYFINLVHYHDLRFGTQNPIQMQDADEGVNIHVRAAGLFGAHIQNDDIDGKDVIKFLRKVVGTRKVFTKDELSAYLRGKIVERVSDTLGQTMIAKGVGILKVSAYYKELSDSLKEQMIPYFADYGIAIDNFSFMSINVPDEDLKAINESKIAAKKMDLESEAMARKRAREGYTYQDEKGFDVMKTAAGNEATMGTFMGAGMGLGMGVGMGGAFGGAMNNMAQNTFGNMGQQPQHPQYQQQPQYQQYQQQPQQPQQPQGGVTCSCGAQLPQGTKFCPQCGSKLGNFCPECGSEIQAGAKFCGNCGHRLVKVCPECKTELQPGAKFCPECGTKC